MTEIEKIQYTLGEARGCINRNTNLNRDCTETLKMIGNAQKIVKKLIIPNVGSTFAVEFAQYIAEEHFRLVNVQNGAYYWKDETSLRTTEQLLEHFKNTKQ